VVSECTVSGTDTAVGGIIVSLVDSWDFASCELIDKRAQTRAKLAQSFFQLLTFFFSLFQRVLTDITID
jgi:hypothetical protein